MLAQEIHAPERIGVEARRLLAPDERRLEFGQFRGAGRSGRRGQEILTDLVFAEHLRHRPLREGFAGGDPDEGRSLRKRHAAMIGPDAEIALLAPNHGRLFRPADDDDHAMLFRGRALRLRGRAEHHQLGPGEPGGDGDGALGDIHNELVRRGGRCGGEQQGGGERAHHRSPGWSE